jgi:hypothetical protein
LVSKVFDTSDETLGIDPEERKQLALAYLSNKAAIDESHVKLSLADYEDADVFLTHEQQRKRLWELVPVYPDHDVQWQGLRCLGGEDAWKAAAYERLKQQEGLWAEDLRRALLLNTTERDIKTLKLGANDTSRLCRDLAYEKYSDPDKGNKFWRIAGHVWTAAFDAAVLVVVLLIFARVETLFERLAVALLVAIYLKLREGIDGLSLAHFGTLVGLAEEFDKLARLIGEKRTRQEKELSTEQLGEGRRKLNAANVKMLIHAIFQSLMWIAVIYNVAVGLL